MSISDVGPLIYRLDDPLKSIKDDQQAFNDVAQSQLSLLLRPYQLSATLSLSRLNEARFYWLADLERIGTHELDGSNPDHFKQSGHLRA